MLLSPYGFMIYYHNNKEFIEMKEIFKNNKNTEIKQDYKIEINHLKDVNLITEYFT